MLVAGCYTLRPIDNNGIALGTAVGLDINDAGRVALGGSMGASIARVQGRLVERDASSYMLAVSGVEFLRGGEQGWNGERVRIQAEHVSSVSERILSKGRTAALTTAVVASFVLAVRSGLVGSLIGDEGRLPEDTAQTIRIPRP
jgi:hypothetical protein